MEGPFGSLAYRREYSAFLAPTFDTAFWVPTVGTTTPENLEVSAYGVHVINSFAVRCQDRAIMQHPIQTGSVW